MTAEHENLSGLNTSSKSLFVYHLSPERDLISFASFNEECERAAVEETLVTSQHLPLF